MEDEVAGHQATEILTRLWYKIGKYKPVTRIPVCCFFLHNSDFS
jgi:hypothetical protein